MNNNLKYVNYNIFDYTHFNPLYGNVLTFPKDSLLWRCYNDKYDIITDRPTFFSSRDVALQYKKGSDRKCAIFKTTKTLRLIDIRYMKILLNELIKNFTYIDTETGPIIKTIALGLGLTSFQKQIKLYKERYRQVLNKPVNELKNDDKYTVDVLEHMINVLDSYDNDNDLNNKKGLNPLELEGIRIGETTNDVELSIYLQKIFSYYCDGFIAPKMYSPYHLPNNYINQEILIFNPQQSNLEITYLNADDDIKYNKSFNDYITLKLNKVSFKYKSFEYNFFETNLKLNGGAKYNKYNLDKNNLYLKNVIMDKLPKDKLKKIQDKAELFSKSFNIKNLLPIEFNYSGTTVSPWLNIYN